MKSQLEVLLEVANILDAMGVQYVVVGSVASSLFGLSRATADVDLVADLFTEQAAPLVRALEGEFYVDEEAARRAILARRSFNIIHFDSLFKIDIYVTPEDEFDRQQMMRARSEELLPGMRMRVRVSTPEDTILAKLRWYRRSNAASERQLDDVAGVLKVQGDRLDRAYMLEWAEKIGVGDLLGEMLKK